jgi:hypothetical protein
MLSEPADRSYAKIACEQGQRQLLARKLDLIRERIFMRNFLTLILFFLAFGVTSAWAQKDYCFQNDGLKVRQTVSFTITKNKVEGTMESGGYDKNTSAETFEFTGTNIGNTLRIKFNGKPPYELPRRTKRIVWTFRTRTLKIPMYGKNYVTNKYSNYTASFGKCKEI